MSLIPADGFTLETEHRSDRHRPRRAVLAAIGLGRSFRSFSTDSYHQGAGGVRGLLGGLLWVVFAGYLTTLILSVLAVVGLGFWLARSRQPIPSRARIARFLLLAVTGLICLAMVEGMVLDPPEPSASRMPALPTKFQSPTGSSLYAVVIGESSAYGYPYAEWLSIGRGGGDRELRRRRSGTASGRRQGPRPAGGNARRDARKAPVAETQAGSDDHLFGT